MGEKTKQKGFLEHKKLMIKAGDRERQTVFKQANIIRRSVRMNGSGTVEQTVCVIRFSGYLFDTFVHMYNVFWLSSPSPLISFPSLPNP